MTQPELRVKGRRHVSAGLCIIRRLFNPGPPSNLTAMPDEIQTPPASLQVLPYHSALRDFLKLVDGDVWKWFAERRLSPKYADDVRFELLKSTYRIERDSQRSLYEQAEEVARQLGIAAPMTIYQAQNPLRLNASLAYVP